VDDVFEFDLDKDFDIEEFLNGGPRPSEPSNPAHIPLSYKCWERLEPDMFPRGRGRTAKTPTPAQQQWHELLAKRLQEGQAAAAVVLHTAPLVVAAYAEDYDTCVLLGFDDWLTSSFALRFGSRLVAVYTSEEADAPPEDLHPGPMATGTNLGNVAPQIATFLTEDYAALQAARDSIPPWQWLLAEQRGRAELGMSYGRLRDGRPTRTGIPSSEQWAAEVFR
jgi:hypothetical protein